jgi:hypothetical protein
MGVPPAVLRVAIFVTAAVLTFALVRAVVADDGPPGWFSPQLGEAERTEPDPLVRDLSPYEGLGTWVDAYDYGPAYQTAGHSPPVTPDDLGAMHDAGVRTVYLQVSREDPRSPDGFVDRDLLEAFVTGAHERGMEVVGWYLPTFASVTTDLGHLQDLLDFEVDGERLDGVGVDIELTEAVPNPAIRNARLLRLSEELDDLAGDTPLGAIVLPPVLTEVVNPDYWPSFPWQDLAPHYDVWLPMSYWTLRTPDSGYRDPASYHGQNVDRLRTDLGEDVVVHGVGGIGDEVTGAQLVDFAHVLAEQGAVGGSVYDWATLSEANRTLLARLFADYPDVAG